MKYIITIVVLLLITTIYFITRPEPEFVSGGTSADKESVTAPPVGMEEEDTTRDHTAGSVRKAQMTEEFEKLNKARRDLESLLNRLKVLLWGVNIPKKERDEISETMKNGYGLLKYKKLMGAYTGVKEISDELSQVEYVHDQLKVIEDKYRGREKQ